MRHGSCSPCKCRACRRQYASERALITSRREQLSLPQRSDVWGLALSGGGIRSATFCLGALQALSRAYLPGVPQVHVGAGNTPSRAPSSRLLSRFDYLSTVSGGGYIGSFFCSLFSPQRLRPDDASLNTPSAAATAAYAVLDQEPPGRIHADKRYDGAAPLGEGPMAWLRENGRYLTPSGAGDVFYGVAIALRNWLSVHFVIGMPILLLLVFMAFLRLLFGEYAVPGLFLERGFATDTLWWLPALSVGLWVAPCLLAFWMFYSLENADTEPPRPTKSVSILVCLVVLTVMLGILNYSSLYHGSACGRDWLCPNYVKFLSAFCVLLIGSLVWALAAAYAYGAEDTDAPIRWNFLAFGWLVISFFAGFFIWDWLADTESVMVVEWGGQSEIFALSILSFLALVVGGTWRSNLRYPVSQGFRSIRSYRIRINRWLAGGVQFFLLLVFLFACDVLAGWLYEESSGEWQLSPAAALAAIIWAIRSLASFADEKSWMNKVLKLPLGTLSIVAGGSVLMLLLICWGFLLRWLQDGFSLVGFSAQLQFLSIFLVIMLYLAWVAGSFVGFINLSSLQALYSGRLARTYLGASNGYRFKWESNAKDRVDKLSVSEALLSDDMTLEQYYRMDSCSPLHLVNVTVNLTVDPAERLVQRDRQGLPMCIAPSVIRAGRGSLYTFVVDGVPRIRRAFHSWLFSSEIEQPLTIGHWIATSGAAVTTGLGRQTSVGLSLLLGLANIRLGTWWPARFESIRQDSNTPAKTHSSWLTKMLPTYALLYNEFFARFHGLKREYLYLSDGGHFENTAAYELLRPERKLRLVVICDCGADPLYQFGDLANLIRLARLDLGLEIEADIEFRNYPKYWGLKKVIGCHRDFVGGGKTPGSNEPIKEVDDQCALLFNVYDKDGSTRNLKCMLLVIKPNLISRMNDDVWHYAQMHPDFPNEPTADQFFDEAQFESYRQLGLNMGELLFGGGASSGETYEQLLWGYLDMKFQRMK